MSDKFEVIVHLKSGGYMAIVVDEESARVLVSNLTDCVGGAVDSTYVYRVGEFPQMYVFKPESVAAFEIAELQCHCEEGEEWKCR